MKVEAIMEVATRQDDGNMEEGQVEENTEVQLWWVRLAEGHAA